MFAKSIRSSANREVQKERSANLSVWYSWYKHTYTLEIPYNEIPCNMASLLRAPHASP